VRRSAFPPHSTKPFLDCAGKAKRRRRFFPTALLGRIETRHICPTIFYDNGRLARVLEAQSFVEKDPLALDLGASAHEKIAQLGSVVLPAGRRVKPEKKFAAGPEVLLQIA
jgi:hypothetical protein